MQFDAMKRFGLDADNVMCEIAQMEMAMAKVSVESGIEIMFKVAMITETSVSVMRDDVTPVKEMLDHVSSSIDKGIVTATTTVFPGKVAKLSDDEVSRMIMSVDQGDECINGIASKIIKSNDYDRVKDVVICISQYKYRGVPRVLMITSDVTENPTGGNTLGNTECVSFNSCDHIPVHGDFIFDGTKLVELHEPNG